MRADARKGNSPFGRSSATDKWTNIYSKLCFCLAFVKKMRLFTRFDECRWVQTFFCRVHKRGARLLFVLMRRKSERMHRLKGFILWKVKKYAYESFEMASCNKCWKTGLAGKLGRGVPAKVVIAWWKPSKYTKPARCGGFYVVYYTRFAMHYCFFYSSVV